MSEVIPRSSCLYEMPWDFFFTTIYILPLSQLFNLKSPPHTQKKYFIFFPFFCKKMYVFANINYVDILQNIWRQNEKI